MSSKNKETAWQAAYRNSAKECDVPWCDKPRNKLNHYCIDHAYRNLRYGDPKFVLPSKAQTAPFAKIAAEVLDANIKNKHVIAAQQTLTHLVKHCVSHKNERVRRHAKRLGEGFNTSKALRIILTNWLWCRECLTDCLLLPVNNETRVRDRLIGRRFLSVTSLQHPIYKCANPGGRVCQVFGELITQHLFKLLISLTEVADNSRKIEQQAQSQLIELNYPKGTLAIANMILSTTTTNQKEI